MPGPIQYHNNGDLIDASHHNVIGSYIEDATYRINTKHLEIGGSLVIDAGWNGSFIGSVVASGFTGDGTNITNVLSNVIEDTTPQLGGDLDGQTYNISTTGSYVGSFVGDGSGLNGINEVEGNFLISDNLTTPGKQYRFRTSGGALDLEAAGQPIYISVWGSADFSGGQYNKMILHNADTASELLGDWSISRDFTFSGTDTSGLNVKSLTTTQRNNIVSPNTGALIYNQDNNDFNYYDGASWNIIPDIDWTNALDDLQTSGNGSFAGSVTAGSFVSGYGSFTGNAVAGSFVGYVPKAMGVVVDDTGSATRPNYDVVQWIGSLEPSNANNNDLWVNTT